MGVSQGSILEPLLFLLYINYLSKISEKSLLYADDTVLFFKYVSMIELQKILDDELPKLYKWLQVNQIFLNTNKTFCQIYNMTKMMCILTRDLLEVGGVRRPHFFRGAIFPKRGASVPVTSKP